MEQQDLLQEVEQEIYFERASTGARFVNLLIDVICLYITTIVLVVAIGVGALARHTASYDTDIYQSSSRPNFITNYLYGAIIWIIFYTLFEGATKGRSIGKFITGTRAVQLNGQPLTWKDAFIRSLCRIVPFEVFSGFGTPWHDTWSGTQVIKVRK